MSVRQGYYGLVRQVGPWTPTKKDLQNINAPASNDRNVFIRPGPYTPSKPSSNPSKYVQRKVVEEPYIVSSRGVKLPLGVGRKPLAVELPPGQTPMDQPAAGRTLGEAPRSDFPPGPGGPGPEEEVKQEGDVKQEGEVKVEEDGPPPLEPVMSPRQYTSEPSEESRYEIGNTLKTVAMRVGTYAADKADQIVTNWMSLALPYISYMMYSKQISLEVALQAMLGKNAPYITKPIRGFYTAKQQITNKALDTIILPTTQISRDFLVLMSTWDRKSIEKGALEQIGTALWNQAVSAGTSAMQGGQAALMSGAFNQATERIGTVAGEQVPSMVRLLYNALATQASLAGSAAIEYVSTGVQALSQEALNRIPQAVVAGTAAASLPRAPQMQEVRRSGSMNLRRISSRSYIEQL